MRTVTEYHELLTLKLKAYQDEHRDKLVELEEVKQRIVRVEGFIGRLEERLEEWKREALTSPSIDVLALGTTITRELRKIGIRTVYELRYHLRDELRMDGFGEKRRARLAQVLAAYDAQQGGGR